MSRLDSERRSWLEETCQHYEAKVGEEVASYLAGRGLDMEELSRFRLGFVADPPVEHRVYSGRLAIPVIKRIGVCGFKFRCIDDHACDGVPGHPKYLTQGPQAIYNVAALDSQSKVLDVTEGEPDTWVLSSVLRLSSIGMPGVKSWGGHKWWRRNLNGFRSIRIWADNDEGKAKNYGREMAEQMCKDLDQAWIVELPPGMDVSEVYMEKGPGYLAELAGL